MNILHNNPYRMLGVFGNANDKEMIKQLALIKRYAEIGREPPFELDFPFLGSVSRNHQDAQHAYHKVEKPGGKVRFALFWFVNHNHIDELAFGYLKQGDTGKAAEIWEKALHSGISDRNHTAAMNLSTLLLCGILQQDTIDFSELRNALDWKLKALSSTSLDAFILHICGENMSIDKVSLFADFTNDLLLMLMPLVDSTSDKAVRELLSLFDGHDECIRKQVCDRFTAKHIAAVEMEIERLEKMHGDNPKGVFEGARQFASRAGSELEKIKNVLGEKDVRYVMLADQAATLLVDSAHVYFGSFKEFTSARPGKNVLILLKHAKAIACGRDAKHRINEDEKNIQEWIDNEPRRQSERKAKDELKKLISLVEGLTTQTSVTLDSFDRFIDNCVPHLNSMATKLGKTDPVYLEYADLVVTMQGLVIQIYNQESEALVHRLQYDSSARNIFKEMVRKSVLCIYKISQLDCSAELKATVRTNYKAIKDVADKIGVHVTLPAPAPAPRAATPRQTSRPEPSKPAPAASGTSTSNTTSNSGCYIATMAFGDYDHPEVVKLRTFRDRRLLPYAWGRCFVSLYYATSPHAVRLLKNRRTINAFIRGILIKINKVIG